MEKNKYATNEREVAGWLAGWVGVDLVRVAVAALALRHSPSPCSGLCPRVLVFRFGAERFLLDGILISQKFLHFVDAGCG